jgi:hypothetical protein
MRGTLTSRSGWHRLLRRAGALEASLVIARALPGAAATAQALPPGGVVG